jgi:hypothetical protein
MRKPIPEDFDMTNLEYKQLVKEQTQISNGYFDVSSLDIGIRQQAFIEALKGSVGLSIYMGLFGGFIGFLLAGLLKENIKPFSIIGAILGSSFVFISFFKFEHKEQIRRKLLSDHKFHKITLYKKAMEHYELCQENYWKSLRGVEFEKALANLYRSLGHSVQETKGSGDGGIDLILDDRIIVQCKSHEKPIGVGAIRDLYGVLMHTRADSAILACPAGFSDGVRKFAEGKPIKLIALKEIIEMAESVNNDKKNLVGSKESAENETHEEYLERLYKSIKNPSPELQNLYKELKSRGLLGDKN